MCEGFTFRKAALNDLELLTATRLEVLRAVSGLSSGVDMAEVEKETYQYYAQYLGNEGHVAYLVFDRDTFAGCGGISFYRVMPSFHNPSGEKAYLMNIYTREEYRRKGIAKRTLDLLVQEAKKRNVTQILLEATEMGRPMYEQYGFIAMENEMELV